MPGRGSDRIGALPRRQRDGGADGQGVNSGKVSRSGMAKHGRYNIVRRVADGGMAEIFLATQLGRDGFQKPVILKRIHSTIYADPQFRNMFIDEAHISMSLAHSNIAQVLDLGVAAGPLLPGAGAGRRVGPRTRDAAGRDRGHAAAARARSLHRRRRVPRARLRAQQDRRPRGRSGIVHRDISPHNVLLSEQGEIKLTDFGIAKAMNKREQTGTGVVKGKVAFMSPEQAMGKPIDQRSDLFSLGHGSLSIDGAGAPVRGADRSRDVAARAEGRLHAARGRRARSRARGGGDHQPRAQARRRASVTRAPTRCWPTSSTCCAACSGRSARPS